MPIYGLTDIWIKRASGILERVAIRKKNSINPNFPSALETQLTTYSDIAMDSLFTTGDDDGTAENGNDGIIVGLDNGGGSWTWKSMITTTATPTNSYAKKWHGEITVGASASFDQARIGKGCNFGGIYEFPYSFNVAYQNFNTVSMNNGDQMLIDWEIYFQ